MKSLLLLSALCVSFCPMSAQDCFMNCFERATKSTTPMPERNFEVMQSLVGCAAPEFTVMDIKGERITLNELRDKVVVMNFWYTSCAACVAEIPVLNQLTKEYREKDVVFLAFDYHQGFYLADFLDKNPFNYRIIASDEDFAMKYCIIGGWPTHMVLDKHGVVRLIFSGGGTEEKSTARVHNNLKSSIEKYLNN